MTDLTSAASHFKFGRNWESYAQLIDANAIAEAEAGLVRLLGPDGVAGRSFIDIGSGSGLHCLAAIRLGASHVTAVDIDADSVRTTKAVLDRYAPHSNPLVAQASVFDLDSDILGRFDVVYSWGVLHHTGDMQRAIHQASRLTADGGLLAVALYRRTLCCRLWRLEKRWYSQASPQRQAQARAIYETLLRWKMRMQGRNYRQWVDTYHSRRGMDYLHDVHDWLGGYPYESISPAGVDRILRPLGFEHLRSFTRRGLQIGLQGSACAEYVYRRSGAVH